MPVADRLEDHQARCLPHLLRLRMLVGTPEAPLRWLAAVEVTRATEAILAEAGAAIRAVTGGGTGGPGTGVFMGTRLNRLAAAADDAIAAAWAGDFSQLRRHLRRFDTLTSAIWAVQDATRSHGAAGGYHRHS